MGIEWVNTVDKFSCTRFSDTDSRYPFLASFNTVKRGAQWLSLLSVRLGIKELLVRDSLESCVVSCYAFSLELMHSQYCSYPVNIR